jgi:hypothetical protein
VNTWNAWIAWILKEVEEWCGSGSGGEVVEGKLEDPVTS